MRAAGVRVFGGPVEALELPDPREPAADEVLVEVCAAGVGFWDDVVRTGDWDVGGRAPLALGVEVAGRVAAVGSGVEEWAIGDEVMAHPLPLREQGTWAERVIAPAEALARKPAGVDWPQAAAFPVPAITAEQVVSEALAVSAGDWVLVHGAGTLTGSLIVLLAARRGGRVVATAGPRSADRARELGATEVVDYHDAGWPDRIRALTDGRGVDAAANAARGDEAAAARAVADGGRFATITGAPPAAQRDLRIVDLYVRPDGGQLRRVGPLLGDGFSVPVGAVYPLARAADALAAAVGGRSGGAVALTLL